MHLDIKPDNLVEFTAPDSPKLYVIDYSNVEWHSNGDSWMTGGRRTQDRTIPEVADRRSWDPRPADMWAVAETLKSLAEVSCRNETKRNKTKGGSMAINFLLAC